MPSEQNAQVKAMYEDMVASLAPTEDHTPGIPDIRNAYEALCAKHGEPEDTTFEETELGGVPVISALHNSAMGDAVILYLHGGGYVIGSADGYRVHGSAMSKASGSKVVLVDYRLAPEHPHPAAVEDGVNAFKALLDEGLQETDITIAGDSAGGGLAVAVLVALRDEGVELPAGAVLFSPFADLTGDAASLDANADKDPIVSRDLLGTLGSLYIGEGDARNPLISPVFADLQGLPPLLIFVGTEESLYDDATTLAANAEQAGVEVQLVVGEEMYHVWPCFSSVLPEGLEAVEHAGRFIAEMTNTPTIR